MALYYFITECKPPENEFNKVTYGIGVEMYINYPDKETVKERKVVESVFTDRRLAVKFLNILCESFVTPTTLADVIYDYIA